MITEDYATFEVAKLLKEKGFDEATHQYYKTITYLGTEANNVCIKTLDGIESEPFNNSIYGFDLNGEDTGEYACPTLQMAMKWLREEHKIEIRVIYDNERLSWYGACNPMNEPSQILLGFGRKSKSYEEACEAGIRWCLENLI